MPMMFKRTNFLLAAASLLLLLACPSAALGPCSALQKGSRPAFTGCQILREDRTALLWRTAKKSDVYFKLVVQVASEKDLGWMAFGFSDIGSMTGADMYVIHQNDSSGGWTVTDTHGVGFVTPVPDESQDARLVSMEFDAAASTWSAVVVRKTKTCDLLDDFTVSARANYILWATGAADGPGFANIVPHSLNARGSVPRALVASKKRASALRVGDPAAARAEAEADAAAASYAAAADAGARAAAPSRAEIESAAAAVAEGFLATAELSSGVGAKCMGAACAPAPEAVGGGDGAPSLPATPYRSEIVTNADGSMSMDVKCPSAIPDNYVTTYMNCYIEMPQDRDYHITSYTTLWGHPLVHHSIIYSCEKERAEPLVEALVAATGPGPYNQREHRQLCTQFFATGPAPAYPTYTFPPNVGLPMGSTTNKFIAIEVHYNNPMLLKDQYDNGTGLTLVFEPKNPKKFDAGVLTISQYDMQIPPGQESVMANASTCGTKCTAKFSQDVTMFNQFVHMHGLGKSVITKRVRNGVELEPLAWVKGFDYNFQTWISMPSQQVVLKRGDELSVTCEFDSRSRSNMTTFGYGTGDEMCFWWIYIYPAQPKYNICSSLGSSPVQVCAPDLTGLLGLREASLANNRSAISAAVGSMIDAGTAMLEYPVTVEKPFNISAGCSAKVP